MIQVKKAGSIPEAFEETVNLLGELSTQKDKAYCWFRGVNDSEKYKLIPGAYRDRETKYDEWEVLMEFVQGGPAFMDVGAIDTWDTYYLAQHHAVPTRLLDWTESFSAALFFALDGWDGKTTPCVWILQPCKLNELTMRYEGVMAPENWNNMSNWLPLKIKKHYREEEKYWVYDNEFMIAIYPRKTNRRIVAQQATFTVHGRSKQSISEFIEEKTGNSNQIIARIDLESIDLEASLRHLELLGIRKHTIYPDIDNFIKYLRSIYSW